MVSQSDLAKVNRLNEEYQNITRAIENLDGGGRIVTMVISAPQPENGNGFPMGQAAVVPTQYINYPDQMIDAIKHAVDARMHEIRDELASLGVTGLADGRAARQQAAPQQQRQQPPQRQQQPQQSRSGQHYRDRAGR